ncbi:SMP-30/gluconolactonase/LRE family protein [Marinilabiliaceae bacterium JC017]|nr:SMP-30/gluconolactonase/LRE family protein [Marinilabiliaceae bacterium JC017]
MKNLLLTTLFVLLLVVNACRMGDRQGQKLYQVFDVTPDSLFMPWAEGPVVDENGCLYAVNYKKKGTIGVVYPDGLHELFLNLPEGSVGNGLRIVEGHYLLVADYTNHNVLKVDVRTKELAIYAHDSTMNQPNDIAVTAKGIVFASDPNWSDNTGNLWRINTQGIFELLESDMGTTNGVEVSSDDQRLYVNESVQRNIWVYDLDDQANISNKRLFFQFPDFGMDGMRCDAAGNLYVTRFDKGTVAILSPDGELLREVKMGGQQPTNIAFGGEDGKTCFVTVADRGCIQGFRTEYPGRAFLLANSEIIDR